MIKQKILFEPIYCFRKSDTEVIVKSRKVKYQPTIEFTTPTTRSKKSDSITDVRLIGEFVHLRIKSGSSSEKNCDFLLVGRIISVSNISSNYHKRDGLKKHVADAFKVDPSYVRRIVADVKATRFNSTLHRSIRTAYFELVSKQNAALNVIKNKMVQE